MSSRSLSMCNKMTHTYCCRATTFVFAHSVCGSGNQTCRKGMTCPCYVCFWNLISKDLKVLRLVPNYLAADIGRLLRSCIWGWGWDNLKAGLLWSCQLECQYIASSCDLGFLAIWRPKDGGSGLKLLRGSCRAFWGLALQVTGVTSA